MYDFKLRRTYTFDVYPVAILGNDFKNVTVVAILTQEQANKEVDTNALHVQVFPYLAPGTPNRADGYDYVKIRFPSGTTTVLGMEWIKEDSVVQTTATTITVKIGDVDPSDYSRIRSALLQNGFNNIAISVE